MNGFDKAFEYIVNKFPVIGFFDILDIFIVTVLFYYVYKFVRERRAGKLAVGILFIILAMVLSSVLNMNALNFIISNIVQVGIIGLIILFQAELRSFLEKVGGEPLKGLSGKKVVSTNSESINVLANAAVQLSMEKTGALIVLERGTKLGDVIKSGTIVNANPSVYLIQNIFFDKSPLHDGAMIIRNGRIYAAGCMLPLSQDETILKTLGTRHRAAIGMSENSDAAVIVVSEETGTISIAVEGHLTRGLSKEDLLSRLEQLLLGKESNEEEGNVQNTVHKTIGKILPIYRKNEDGKRKKAHGRRNGTTDGKDNGTGNSESSKKEAENE